MKQDYAGTNRFFTLIAADDDHPYAPMDDALLRREKSLQRLLRFSSDGFIDWHITKNLAYYSTGYFRKLGYAPGELPKNADEMIGFVTPGDTIEFETQLREYVEGKRENHRIDLQVRARDGSLRWVTGRGGIVERDEDGRPSRIISAYVDITEDVRTKIALDQNKALLKAIIESIPFDVFALDTSEHYTLQNPTCVKSWGNILGKRPEDVAPNVETLSCWKENNRRVLSGETVWEESETPERSEQRYLFKIMSPILEKDLVIGILGIHIDVTDRRQAENALRNSEKKYRDLFENSLVGLGISTSDGKILAMNRAMQRISGYSFEDIAVAGVAINYLHPEDREKLLQIMRRDGKVENFEVQLKNKSGEPYWASLSTRPIVYQGENAFLTTKLDITERKRIEQENADLQKQLMMAQKMEALGTLSGGIAHDFNNLLTPILGYSELLLSTLPEDSPHAVKLNQILQAGIRARSLIGKILSFSRFPDGAARTIEVQDMIEESLGLLRHSMPKTISIVTNVNTACSPIVADPDHIQQMIMNLCSNALHAMEKTGGTLTIGLDEVHMPARRQASSPGRHLCLSVKDTGEGIPAQHMDKLFLPYFSTKERGKGTGFGLALVHGMVSKMKGDIQVTSQLGKGSEFRIYLPLENVNEAPAPIVPENGLRMGHERILLVDDDRTVIHVLKAILSRLGYRVTARSNSRGAFECFRKDPRQYDLVITDMIMPGMTGAVLCEKIKSLRPDIPIILCSGYSDRIEENQAKKLGARGFLTKPVMMDHLSSVIRNALDGAAPGGELPQRDARMKAEP